MKAKLGQQQGISHYQHVRDNLLKISTRSAYSTCLDSKVHNYYKEVFDIIHGQKSAEYSEQLEIEMKYAGVSYGMGTVKGFMCSVKKEKGQKTSVKRKKNVLSILIPPDSVAVMVLKRNHELKRDAKTMSSRRTECRGSSSPPARLQTTNIYRDSTCLKYTKIFQLIIYSREFQRDQALPIFQPALTSTTSTSSSAPSDGYKRKRIRQKEQFYFF
ncbi:hypothetical protein L5515_002047 [Caenorhabditis briggsae]|uniref:Uncharacterized protein n=1 Tax=Caenorhabditis briggsae TaxID=6238 RepID=A0AAE9E4R8_CAEBR|nr:hypothetical protein L5515_002047 [Caenorhabditis briggsae]